MKTAPEYLQEQRNILTERGQLRDQSEGERSMAKTVQAFNIIHGTNLTETQGWQFMQTLKMVRSAYGEYHEDDYQDSIGYASLAAESANKEADKLNKFNNPVLNPLPEELEGLLHQRLILALEHQNRKELLKAADLVSRIRAKYSGSTNNKAKGE